MKWHVDKNLYMRIRLEDSSITIGPDHTSKNDLFMLIVGRKWITDDKCIQVLKAKGEGLLLKKREKAKTYSESQEDMRKKLSDACKETTGKSSVITATWKEIIRRLILGQKK